MQYTSIDTCICVIELFRVVDPEDSDLFTTSHLKMPERFVFLGFIPISCCFFLSDISFRQCPPCFNLSALSVRVFFLEIVSVPIGMHLPTCLEFHL